MASYSLNHYTFNEVPVFMKRILTSCLLGVLLTSTVLAEQASAQVRIIFGGNDRGELRQDQREWRERQRRLYEQRELRERREQRERFERQREQRQRFERQRGQREWRRDDRRY